MSAPLDFSLTSIHDLKTEVDAALSTLISTLNVVDKFAKFLPGNLGADVEAAIAVLTEIKAVFDKFA